MILNTLSSLHDIYDVDRKDVRIYQTNKTIHVSTETS